MQLFILPAMPHRALPAVISKNLAYLMARPGSPYKNPNALGIAAKVAPNTIRHLLDPTRRPVTATKPEGYPTLDKLEKIARTLNREVWELLHPDIERAIREREMYKRLEKDFRALPPLPSKQTTA